MGSLNGWLLRWHEGQLEDVTHEMDESTHPIRCLSAMPDGSLWIGYAAGGLGG